MSNQIDNKIKQITDELLQFRNEYSSHDPSFNVGLSFAIGYAIGSVQKTFLEKDNEQEE